MLAFGVAGAALGSAAGSALVCGAIMPLWWTQAWSGAGWLAGPAIGEVKCDYSERVIGPRTSIDRVQYGDMAV